MYHKDLEVWKSSLDLVLDIYNFTKMFPKDEVYGLTSQIRCCAISIPSNIAEGFGRFSDKDTYKFLSIAIGSLAELDTQIVIANQLGYINDITEIQEKINKVSALLLGLKKHFDKIIS